MYIDYHLGERDDTIQKYKNKNTFFCYIVTRTGESEASGGGKEVEASVPRVWSQWRGSAMTFLCQTSLQSQGSRFRRYSPLWGTRATILF